MLTSFNEARLCIVGLGLMGGSLGMALRSKRACQTITGSDSQAAVCDLAVALGAVDEATTDVAQAVRQANVVILATPVRTIARLITDLGPHLQPDALLMDLGSTKRAIAQSMAMLPPSIHVVGGHPMCGKETAGVAAAEPTLYQGAAFCLTPLERTLPEALALAETLVRAIGARPLILDAERHDRLVAAASHLPYLMSVALTGTASDVSAHDPMLWQLAASGFRDTSRLAGSNVVMMVDILQTNREYVSALARQAAQRLLELAGAIEAGDEETLRSTLALAQQARQAVYR